jgi:hypothetical protein
MGVVFFTAYFSPWSRAAAVYTNHPVLNVSMGDAFAASREGDSSQLQLKNWAENVLHANGTLIPESSANRKGSS